MMRIVLFNLSAFAVLAIYNGAQAQDIPNRIDVAPDSLGAQTTLFLVDHGNDVLSLMKQHFDLSVRYMYTGIGFGSQMVQKPGMSKYLKEQSDSHWQDGMDLLKKYMQRGGIYDPLLDHFTFTGTNDLTMSKTETSDMREEYLNTLYDLLKDSKTCSKSLNGLHRMSARRTKDNVSPHHDGEWSHYLEEKLEAEAERTRTLAGHITNLELMFKSGMAHHFFDANL